MLTLRYVMFGIMLTLHYVNSTLCNVRYYVNFGQSSSFIDDEVRCSQSLFFRVTSLIVFPLLDEVRCSQSSFFRVTSAIAHSGLVAVASPRTQFFAFFHPVFRVFPPSFSRFWFQNVVCNRCNSL